MKNKLLSAVFLNLLVVFTNVVLAEQVKPIDVPSLKHISIEEAKQQLGPIDKENTMPNQYHAIDFTSGINATFFENKLIKINIYAAPMLPKTLTSDVFDNLGITYREPDTKDPNEVMPSWTWNEIGNIQELHIAFYPAAPELAAIVVNF